MRVHNRRLCVLNRSHQSPLDPSPLDLSTWQDGHEVPVHVVATLAEELRQHFYPSFEKDGIMVFSSGVAATKAEARAEVPASSSADSRPAWKQEQDHKRALRDEGLDEHGEPLRRRSRRP